MTGYDDVILSQSSSIFDCQGSKFHEMITDASFDATDVLWFNDTNRAQFINQFVTQKTIMKEHFIQHTDYNPCQAMKIPKSLPLVEIY